MYMYMYLFKHTEKAEYPQKNCSEWYYYYYYYWVTTTK